MEVFIVLQQGHYGHVLSVWDTWDKAKTERDRTELLNRQEPTYNWSDFEVVAKWINTPRFGAYVKEG